MYVYDICTPNVLYMIYVSRALLSIIKCPPPSLSPPPARFLCPLPSLSNPLSLPLSPPPPPSSRRVFPRPPPCQIQSS